MTRRELQSRCCCGSSYPLDFHAKAPFMNSFRFAPMPLQRFRVHRLGRSLAMQRKVCVLRRSKKPPPKWTWIATHVQNLQGETPYRKVRRDAFNKFVKPPRLPKDAYGNCGRRTIMTQSARKCLVRRLIVLRSFSSKPSHGGVRRGLSRGFVIAPTQKRNGRWRARGAVNDTLR